MAVYYCHSAHEFNPLDYTIWANMAVAKLFQQKLDDAEHWANKCLQKLSNDEVSLCVLKFIEEIRAGARTIPTDFNEFGKD